MGPIRHPVGAGLRLGVYTARYGFYIVGVGRTQEGSMGHWKTESALWQAESDMMAENERDRVVIDGAKRRIDGRVRLLKIIRRHMRRQGLVNTSGDSLHPNWVRKDMVR